MIFPWGVILLKVKHTLVNMLKGIVYTTVFGGYDDLIEQNLPDGWDWICFSEKNTDSEDLSSPCFKCLALRPT